VNYVKKNFSKLLHRSKWNISWCISTCIGKHALDLSLYFVRGSPTALPGDEKCVSEILERGGTKIIKLRRRTKFSWCVCLTALKLILSLKFSIFTVRVTERPVRRGSGRRWLKKEKSLVPVRVTGSAVWLAVVNAIHQGSAPRSSFCLWTMAAGYFQRFR